MERSQNYPYNPASFKYTRTNLKKWPYKFTADFSIDLFYLHGKRLKFSASSVTHPYFSINLHGGMKIKAEYAWNGANKPAYKGGQNLFASAIHDVICQATNEGLLPYSDRYLGDKIYFYLMQDRAKSVFQKIRCYYSYAALISFTTVKGIFNKPKYRG